MTVEEQVAVLRIVLEGTRKGEILWRSASVENHYMARLSTGEGCWDLHLAAPTEATRYLVVDSVATGQTEESEETEETIRSYAVGDEGAAMLGELLKLVRGPLAAQRTERRNLLEELSTLPWTTGSRVGHAAH